MRTLLAALAERGVPAVHLVMAVANRPARAFYDRLGFEEIERVPMDASVVCLGRTTGSSTVSDEVRPTFRRRTCRTRHRVTEVAGSKGPFRRPAADSLWERSHRARAAGARPHSTTPTAERRNP